MNTTNNRYKWVKQLVLFCIISLVSIVTAIILHVATGAAVPGGVGGAIVVYILGLLGRILTTDKDNKFRYQIIASIVFLALIQYGSTIR